MNSIQTKVIAFTKNPKSHASTTRTTFKNKNFKFYRTLSSEIPLKSLLFG